MGQAYSCPLLVLLIRKRSRHSSTSSTFRPWRRGAPLHRLLTRVIIFYHTLSQWNTDSSYGTAADVGHSLASRGSSAATHRPASVCRISQEFCPSPCSAFRRIGGAQHLTDNSQVAGLVVGRRLIRRIPLLGPISRILKVSENCRAGLVRLPGRRVYLCTAFFGLLVDPPQMFLVLPGGIIGIARILTFQGGHQSELQEFAPFLRARRLVGKLQELPAEPINLLAETAIGRKTVAVPVRLTPALTAGGHHL